MRPPIDYFGDHENLRPEILFGSFGKSHLLFPDAHVLPTRNVAAFATRTRLLCAASSLYHIASTSESVTREGAMLVVE